MEPLEAGVLLIIGPGVWPEQKLVIRADILPGFAKPSTFTVTASVVPEQVEAEDVAILLNLVAEVIEGALLRLAVLELISNQSMPSKEYCQL